MSRDEIRKKLLDAKVIAVLRAPETDTAFELMKAYVAAGIKAIELTTSCPSWDKLLSRGRADFGGLATMGLGTVTSARDAEAAIDSGAQFIVSPFISPPVIETANRRDVPVIPGALSPTEIAHAYELGACMVKVFPVSAVGGPKYVKALLAPMPDWELIPTGGVTPENAIEYFKAGAAGVGLGGNLAPTEKVLARDWDGITSVVRGFMENLQAQLGEEK